MKDSSARAKRLEISGIPIIHEVARRIGIRNIIEQFIPKHGNEKFYAVDSLIIIIYNITKGRLPLYQIGDWLAKHDPKCFEYFPSEKLQDDSFALALDKLYSTDRASMMTEIVVKMIKEFNINIDQIHNDSTTVKAYGKYENKAPSGFELKHGYSKDHRPDLKQLLFTLTVSEDGFVPVHYKSYSGNRSDSTTHIETWETIRKIFKRDDFVYVADSKVCTSKQLSHITNNGGRVISIVPQTWDLGKDIREELKSGVKISKKTIWRKKDDYGNEDETYSVLSRDITTEEGYKVYWIHSNIKSKTDLLTREKNIKKVDYKLMDMLSKINKRNLKTKEQINSAVTNILKKYKMEKIFDIKIDEVKEGERKQIGRGRPTKDTKYRYITNTAYRLSWSQNKQALRNEKNGDGVFPLLSTDPSITAKKSLKAYKQQPRLEKRFTHFKSVHEAAPLLFKRVDRVESIMFLFFLALMIQALIEREVRLKMKETDTNALPLYPENRLSLHPTTSKVLEHFEGVSSYQLIKNEKTEDFRDDLTPLQGQLLKFMNIAPSKYWEL